jgi:hypothetical protein
LSLFRFQDTDYYAVIYQPTDTLGYPKPENSNQEPGFLVACQLMNNIFFKAKTSNDRTEKA